LASSAIPPRGRMRRTPARRIDHRRERPRGYFVPGDRLVEPEGGTFHRVSWG
jgi:hypothetical protein